MKHTANIDANESVELCTVVKRENVEMFEATVFVTGTFDDGTVTIQASPDGGTTKVTLKDVAGTVVSITSDDVYNIRVGYADKLGEEIKLYATMAASNEATTDVDVVVFDNA